MTIKEIAKLTGRNQTTIQRWIKRVPDAKRIELDAKCTESIISQKPADFTLDETIAIIRAGGNETLAGLLLENANKREAVSATTIPNQEVIVKIAYEIAKQITIQLLESKQVRKLPAPKIRKETPKILYHDAVSQKLEWRGRIFFIEKSTVYIERWALKIYRPEFRTKHLLKDKFLSSHLASKFLTENFS